MKKAQIALLSLICLVLIIRVFKVPYNGVLLLVSFFLLALVFSLEGIFLFKSKITQKNVPEKDLPTLITGIVMSVLTLGIFFKIQVLEIANITLQAGLLGLVLIIIFILTKIQENTQTYYSNLIKKLGAIGIVSMLVLTILSSEAWIRYRYDKHPEYIKAVLDAKANPDNQELQNKKKEETQKMIDLSLKKRNKE